MTRISRRILRLFRRSRLVRGAAVAIGLTSSASALAQIAPLCESAGQQAEQTYGLPQGLLLAVGQVESGRWDPQLGRVVPWPWAVDSAGHSQWFDNKADAIAAVRTLKADGHSNIDVGCFQINLQHHPDAFATLDQAFDPGTNADYAARLLVTLHSMLGNWQDAVAAYHSTTPDLGTPYREKVLAAWSGTPAESAAGMQQVRAFGIRVWTPAVAGAAPAVIAIRAQAPRLLPRIVTPSQ